LFKKLKYILTYFQCFDKHNFFYVTVNIQNVLPRLKTVMETPAPLVSGIVNNALFHSSPQLNQTLHQSSTFCTFVRYRLVGELCPRFCSQFDWCQGSPAATNLEVHRSDHGLLDYCTFRVEAANDARTVWVNTACGKDHSQTTISKLMLWYRNVYITNHIRRLKKPLIKFSSSRRTSRNRCYL